MEVIIQILKEKIPEAEKKWNEESLEEEKDKGLFFEAILKIDELNVDNKMLSIVGRTLDDSITVDLYVPLWELIEHADVDFLKKLEEAFNARRQKLETILKKEESR